MPSIRRSHGISRNLARPLLFVRDDTPGLVDQVPWDGPWSSGLGGHSTTNSVLFLGLVQFFDSGSEWLAFWAVAFKSCDTAVTSCAGANGFCNSRLSGTPWDTHWSAAAPVM